jgi:hypothetical protein
MFSIKFGRKFELAVEAGGIYLKVGKRDWHWSNEQGFSHD